MKYKTMSIKQLFAAYASKNNRICKEDAKNTKKLITLELYRRLKVSLDSLEDATEDESVQIYNQFIEH